jgi:hypothetical protein
LTHITPIITLFLKEKMQRDFFTNKLYIFCFYFKFVIVIAITVQ